MDGGSQVDVKQADQYHHNIVIDDTSGNPMYREKGAILHVDIVYPFRIRITLFAKYIYTYPEFDFVNRCCQQMTMYKQLQTQVVPWSTYRIYNIDTVNIKHQTLEYKLIYSEDIQFTGGIY